ncbi:MAG: hypothetical protein FWF96_02920 [Kiritimatiellaeota bacterium]|nr:hypothetical protein [Kiritimatiellota bacterium]
MNMKRHHPFLLLAVFFTAASAFAAAPAGAELKVGAVTCDITPPGPVLLDGQMYARVSQKVTTPLTANILALEGGMDGRRSSALVISFDLVAVRTELDKALRAAIKKTLPDFDEKNMVFCATHTHTAPVVNDTKYSVPKGTDHMKPSEYVAFAAGKVARAAAEAWAGRQPAKFSHGLGFAAIANNRRSVYADDRAVMYGKTNQPDFRRMEGMEDHDVGTMFFWDQNDRLLAMLVNISCPAQEVESLKEVHADFWHPAREALRAKHGGGTLILATVGAAGDMSPRTLHRKAAEERMRKLRGLSRIGEIARRVVQAVDESYEVARNDKKSGVPFRHEFAVVPLPRHKISAAECEAAKKEIDALQKKEAAAAQTQAKPGAASRTHRLLAWNRGVVSKYENQLKTPGATFDAPVHVLRIGDAVIATNPFELFTAYGVQMKTRSKAVQTFVVQLAGGSGIRGVSTGGGYLPTAEAYKHGGYSAIPQSVVVGGEGGQTLVEETLKIIDGMFPAEPRD